MTAGDQNPAPLSSRQSDTGEPSNSPLRGLSAHALVIPVLMLSLAATLAILWTPKYLPFQDHPSHLYREHLLLAAARGEEPIPHHFSVNVGVIPNQLSDLLVVGVALLTGMPVDPASRVMLSVYAVGFAFALSWFLRVYHPQAPEYVLLAPLLTFNYFVLMSNENFILSMPLFLSLLAYWGGRWDRSPRRLITGGVLATALYCCHMVSFGCATVILAGDGLRRRLPMRPLMAGLSIFLPGGLLFAIYAARLLSASSSSDTALSIVDAFDSLWIWARTLIHGVGPFLVVLQDSPLEWMYYGGLLLLLAGTLRRLRTSEEARPLVAGILFLLPVSLLLPEWFGIWRPGQRIGLMSLLVLTAFFPESRRWRVLFVAGAVPVLLFLRYREWQYVQAGSGLTTFLVEPFHAPALKTSRSDTVLPIVTEPYVRTVSVHRVFEYYHLLHGGVSPYHLMSLDFSVRYKRSAANTVGLYESVKTRPSALTQFDTVILVGKDGNKGTEWLNTLRNRGWEEAAGNSVTGVFRRSLP